MKISREQRECQKAEIVKYRDIVSGKKTTNVSPRGLTLSFLFREEWKKRISTSYPLSVPLISLSRSRSVSYSNIFSLYSSCWNRLADLAKA